MSAIIKSPTTSEVVKLRIKEEYNLLEDYVMTSEHRTLSAALTGTIDIKTYSDFSKYFFKMH